MRLGLVCLMLVLAACGPLTPPRLDAGAGGGAAMGGGEASGGGTATGGGGALGGGAPTGGGAATGGGTATGGGSPLGGGAGGGAPGTFTWVQLTFMTQPAATTTPRVVGLARRTNGETWTALSNGALYRAAAGSDRLELLPDTPAPTTATELIDLATTGDELLLLRGRSVLRCLGACGSFNDFAQVHQVPFGETPIALCTRGSRALFTARLGTATKLYESQRLASSLSFSAVSEDLGVGSGERCVVSESDDVYVAGATGVAVLRASGGLATESINLAGQPAARWTDVAIRGVGATLEGWLAGGGSGYRFAHRSGGVWTSFTPDTRGPQLNVALALGPGEALLAGDSNSAASSVPSVFRWNGSNFVAWTPAPPAIDVHRGLAVSADEVYLGGTSRAGGAYLILRGSR